MALKLTVESFLQVVRQSGLIEKEQLQKLLQNYAERGVDVKKSQTIADALVGDEVITRWQAEKLLAGKHKGFFLGKYRLLDLLGKGGMSSVYLAEHVLMKRRCAIKVLPAKRVNDTSYLARFHREAQAVASVDHPNIVRAYDVDCAQDRDTQIHFLVMEYVNGQSLQELIIRSGPADYADAIEYIRQSAEGLEHAHRAGLVHRDIKPANLLIDASGTIKILDMGLARFFDDRDENPLTVAHDEKVLGTADYLAPEQALDSHSVDTRADLYSLGCTLYFFLTGHPPFTEGTLTQRLMWHQTKPFPPITDSRLDCPPSLIAVLNKMVEKKPEDRYQSAADVAAACRKWLADNAKADWKQRHVPVPAARDGGAAGASSSAARRDLQSDPALLKTAASHVLESSVSPRQDDGSSATKISRPGAVTPGSSPSPMTTTTAQAPTSVATAPAVSPPVAAPVVAAPVARVVPPIAQPVAPSLPIARPVAPVAMPVAVPVAPISVAPVVELAKAPEVTVAPPNVPAVREETPPDFMFGNDPASDATAVFPAEATQEATEEGDLFSLFSGANGEASVSEPETAPLDISAEPTRVEEIPASEETVSFDPTAASPPDEPEFSFTTPDTINGEVESKPTSTKSSPPAAKRAKNPVAVYAAVAAGLLVMGGVGWWWTTRGTTNGAPTAGKSSKKGRGNSEAEGTEGGAQKSDRHEVRLLVGAGGEFKSIGRALHSVVAERETHEKAANGKPLRFVISIKPGQTFEESIVLDESFPGEVHLKSDTPSKSVKLTPSSNSEPAITIKGLKGVTIENIFVDLEGFPQKDKGVVITGSVPRCRIRNCVISNIGKAGIELSAATGGEGSEAITLEAITFQNSSPTAFGVHITKASGATPTQHVTVQRCRFVGAMSAGVFIEGPLSSLAVRNTGFSGTTDGLRFADGVTVKNVVVDHCSFRGQLESAIVFKAMPGAGSGEFAWRNCLFAGVKKTELLVGQGYDVKGFDALMSAAKPIENNWSDRDASIPVNGERDLLGKGGSRVQAIQFAATSTNSELFLVPKAGEPYQSAGIQPK